MTRETTLRRHDDRESPGPIEKGIMAVTALFTIALFGYVFWQAATTPPEPRPEVSVEAVRALPGGEREVTVTLVNHGGSGVLVANVAVDCGDPPPELQFAHIPAQGRESGVVRCPAGTTAPQARITSWIPA